MKALLIRVLRRLRVLPSLTTSEQMRALFPEHSRLRVRWRVPDDRWNPR